jgi:hypothetical protein
LEREGDQLTLSAPVYAKSQPSWRELATIAAQLWPPGAGVIHIFDENGELFDAE